jgi:hypothetical protein
LLLRRLLRLRAGALRLGRDHNSGCVEAQSHSLGCYCSRVKNCMAASSPCYCEPVVIRRTLIFRLVFFFLLQLSALLEEPSFQNLSETQSGVNCYAGPYCQAAMAVNTHRPALNSLVGWLRAPKQNRVFEAHYGPRQLFIRIRPPTRMSDVFGKLASGTMIGLKM